MNRFTRYTTNISNSKPGSRRRCRASVMGSALLVATLLAVLLLLPPVSARAESFTVTDLKDEGYANYLCTNPRYKDHFCSLRAAINASNANGQWNTIYLPKGHYYLTHPLPPITSSLFMYGRDGSDATVISGPCTEDKRDTEEKARLRGEVWEGECFGLLTEFRVFHVALQGVVVLVDMTIRGGQDAVGGGILNEGILELVRVTVMGNHAHTGGGGIANTGSLDLDNSTVRDNFGHNGSGGGIANASGTVFIEQSTISGNRSFYGGGIYNGTEGRQGGSLSINNSTISGNMVLHTKGYAGGILNSGVGNARLSSVTVTGNTAPFAGGVYGRTSGTGNFYFKNTIIAGNTATAAGKLAPDCFSYLVTLGGNLMGEHNTSTTNCFVTWSSGQDVISKNPMLGSLDDNGGYTCTHKLLDGSPAINAARNDAPGSSGFACETSDQRGAKRNGRCDIGAYEANATVVPLPRQLSCSGL